MLCTDIIKSKISGSSSGGGGISGGRTVTFKADGQTYAISSVKSGQSISAPIPNPTSESGTFAGWLDGESIVTFPFTPEGDTVLNAKFITTVLPQLYEHFDISQPNYPYVVIEITNVNTAKIYFSKTVSADGSGITCDGGVIRCNAGKEINVTDYSNIGEVVSEIMRVYSTSDKRSGTSQMFICASPNYYGYCNTELNPPAQFYKLV